MNIINLLKNSEFFCELEDSELESITNLLIKKTASKNMLFISEGDASDSMYIILEGKVSVMVSNEKGEEFILSTLTRGDIFGELSLLDGHPRSANIVTLEKCVFAMLKRNDLQKLMQDNQAIVINIIKFLCNRVRLVNSLAESMALMDVYGRLVKLLNDLSISDGEGKFIIEKLPTKQLIASQIGCRRERVSTLFNTLIKYGYLTHDNAYKRIIINKKLPSAF